MKKAIFLPVVLLLLGALLPGCSTKKSELGDPKDFETIIGAERDYTEPTVIKEGLGLHARAEGPTIVLSARNQSQKEIAVIHRDLALIVGPNPETDLILISPGSADLGEFSAMMLRPGQRGTRRFTMRDMGDLAGTRLVYNNQRDGIQFYVIVE